MEVTNKAPDNLKDQLREERQARIENKFFGSLKPKRGHRLYKYNFASGKLFELDDADFFDSEIGIAEKFKPVQLVDRLGNHTTIAEQNGKTIMRDSTVRMNVRKKIRIEPNTYYFGSLNETNAKKK